MKQTLRQQKLLERLNHDSLRKKQKDLLIMEKISNLGIFKKSKNILFYHPVHGEVNLIPLHDLNKKTKNFILPRVNKDNSLDFYFINDLNHVKKGRFNIPEPMEHLDKALPEQIDLILVPGIAFDQHGHRIGYGKGYYDRLLHKSSAVKVGIAYDFQLINVIPAEQHDVPMDIIVTDKKTVIIKQ